MKRKPLQAKDSTKTLETLAEEAVCRVAFNEEYQESKGESVHNLPTGFGNIIDMFLHDQDVFFSPLNLLSRNL